jgi:DNA replication protein DnaC
MFGDPTFADAILDRLVHNAYRFALEGPSMRKPEADTDAATTTTEAKLAKGAKK